MTIRVAINGQDFSGESQQDIATQYLAENALPRSKANLDTFIARVFANGEVIFRRQ